jgi:ribonuclease HI
LLLIYKSCVLPIVFYGCELFGCSTVSFDKVQRILSRFQKHALGLLNNTSSELTAVYGDFMPLRYEFPMRSEMYALRTTTLDASHPCRNLFRIAEFKRLKKVYCPTTIDFNLPSSVVAKLSLSDIPPWQPILFSTDFLLDGKSKKSISDTELKQICDQKILSAMSSDFLVFTDGSKKQFSASAAVVLLIKNSDEVFLESDYVYPGFINGTPFDQEVLALHHAVSELGRLAKSGEKIVFFCDNQAVIRALTNIKAEPRVIALQFDLNILAMRCQVKVQWVPSHTNYACLSSHTRADEICRFSNFSFSIDRFRTELSHGAAIASVREKYRDKWLNEWLSCSTGQRQRDELQLLKPVANLTGMSRHDSTIMNRLRVLTCRSRKDAHGRCRHCMQQINENWVVHLLSSCTAFSCERRESCLPNMNVKDLLFDRGMFDVVINFVCRCRLKCNETI